MAFAKQKLAEVVVLATAAAQGKETVASAIAASDAAAKSRSSSIRTHNPQVAQRMATVSAKDLARKSPFDARRSKQRALIPLPLFPTTTIGSFPQTEDVRKARAAHRRGELDDAGYTDFLQKATQKAVRIQEELGIDVLVHGEFERNDMVEYFGEQLAGFAITQNGWVQSYGSRYVKPPVIFGDVSRPKPMTVEWSAFAQSLTKRPMKGMVTGPVTILQWSFVRDDQPCSETCKQIALVIRDEVLDLEKAGIRLIQIDEPALREGLPLRQAERGGYLQWAVDCFHLAAAGVADETQIHTHMCYCEFNDIMPSIAALDADVISIETSRSDMALLESFADFKYPNEIGPGVYDIHSPRCPSANDMARLLAKAKERLAPEQIWINPDCGLKTRRWEEALPAPKEHGHSGQEDARGRLTVSQRDACRRIGGLQAGVSLYARALRVTGRREDGSQPCIGEAQMAEIGRKVRGHAGGLVDHGMTMLQRLVRVHLARGSRPARDSTLGRLIPKSTRLIRAGFNTPNVGAPPEF